MIREREREREKEKEKERERERWDEMRDIKRKIERYKELHI